MLSITISWIIIFIISYIYGKTFITLCYQKKVKALMVWDVYVVCGLMVITIYAQIFSLFAGIGATAFILLALGGIVSTFCLWKKKSGGKDSSCPKLTKLQWFLLGLSVVAALLWTNIIPQHYDTYLYHAQAVHWIEEYGAVPGLGNLHFRLAYNSAFLSLQALFGFKWLLGQSLHTMNGFVVLFCLGYAFLGLKLHEDDGPVISDILKLGMVFYIVISCYNISSLSTDIWSLLLVFYICIKWCELSENGIADSNAYAFMCVLSIYAVTLKLSVVIFVLLTLYPAVRFIRERQWQPIGLHLGLGIANMVPFLARNMILSGYLVYPYPEIDLFHFDWEMSKGVMLRDRQMIIAWGRGVKDIEQIGQSFLKWFPQWFSSIHIVWQAAFCITVLFVAPALAYIIKNIRRPNLAALNLLMFVSVAGLIYWLFSAPLPRYGLIYILLLPGIVSGLFLRFHTGKLTKVVCFIRKRILPACFACGMAFCLCFFFYYRETAETGDITLVMQNDYLNRDTRLVEVNGFSFGVPLESDQTGYEPFPTVLWEGYFDEILEMRGDTLGDGFRYTGDELQ